MESKDTSEYCDEQADQLWANVLIVAPASYPQQSLRDMTNKPSIKHMDRIVDELPDGMLSLVRRCIDLVANNSTLAIEQ